MRNKTTSNPDDQKVVDFLNWIEWEYKAFLAASTKEEASKHEFKMLIYKQGLRNYCNPLPVDL